MMNKSLLLEEVHDSENSVAYLLTRVSLTYSKIKLRQILKILLKKLQESKAMSKITVKCFIK